MYTKVKTFSIRWFCILIERVMTVYENYDVIAFKSCIQIFTVFGCAKQSKNLERCLIEIAKSSQDAGCECESNIIIFIRLDQKSIFAVAPWIKPDFWSNDSMSKSSATLLFVKESLNICLLNQLTKSDSKRTGGGKCPASCQLGLKALLNALQELWARKLIA